MSTPLSAPLAVHPSQGLHQTYLLLIHLKLGCCCVLECHRQSCDLVVVGSTLQ
jgi:hypothetical protein